MRKFVFYHLYAKNNYVKIHNNIFSKIISNPFFDDCTFFFSIVIDDKDIIDWERLIKPKNYFISYYKNDGSERPAFFEMQKRSKEYSFTQNDIVGYLHCKGVSNPCDRDNENEQKKLITFINVEQWVNELSFFIIDNIQKYVPYLLNYGALCVWPTRHLCGSHCKSGTLGNFWWVTGDVACQSIKIKTDHHTRHYFEYLWVGEMLEKSNREYKTSFYIHDGAITIYGNSYPPKIQMINSFWAEELIALHNMDIPFNINSTSIGIIVTQIEDVDIFFKNASSFILNQRFKNLWIKADTPIPLLEFKKNKIKYNFDNILNKEANSLITVKISIDKLIKIKEIKYYIDHLATDYRNNTNSYDINNQKYQILEYDGLKIVPNNTFIGRSYESYKKKS
jgi:hypothetical protein